MGSKTLAYIDTFKNESLAQVCFWGTGQKIKPVAKNMYRYSAMTRKVDKLIDRAIFFLLIFQQFI